MDLEDIKKVAIADVLRVGPKTLEEKLTYYTDDAVVWDPVMRVAGYAETNTASGYKDVKQFFTWLANLPPVGVKIQDCFGEENRIVVEWILLGGADDNKFEIPCANIYNFKDGKIHGVRMHFDSAYFAQIINSN